ncbi:hypothetical protein GCM10009603_02440 [Nocardiopsis exhalans]
MSRTTATVYACLGREIEKTVSIRVPLVLRIGDQLGTLGTLPEAAAGKTNSRALKGRGC